MYAIVREGNGAFYTSVVFGFYNNSNQKHDYEHCYWIVLNRDKTSLVKLKAWGDGLHGIVPTLLIIDCDQSGWILENEKAQSLAFIPADQFQGWVESGTVPSDILLRCISIDSDFVYNPYPEIKTKTDTDNFDSVSGGLHDFYISAVEKNDDSLYVKFKGEWGCDIEVWFSDDVSYHISMIDSNGINGCWLASSLFIQNGYIYLFDDENATQECTREEGWDWFRAKRMKYHVIPE